MEKSKPKACSHGHVGFCGLCKSDTAPKCPQNNPFFCGVCFTESLRQAPKKR